MPPNPARNRSRPRKSVGDASPTAITGNRADGRVRLFRIVPASKTEGAFGDTGSREGRWSSAHTPVVYASLSAACALLEFLAHLQSPPDEALHLVEACAPATSLTEVGPLPDDWSQRPYRPHVQAIGDGWAQARVSLLLRVPSVLAPRECNVLINARHDSFGSIEPVGYEVVSIDPRLRGVFAT